MADESPTVALKCPSCGGNLAITPDLESFACGYCGTQQVVRRSGNTVSLQVIGEAVRAIKGATDRIESATDRVAMETRLRRLRDELAEVESTLQDINDRITKLQNPGKKEKKKAGELWLALIGLPIGLPLGILLVVMGKPSFCPGALIILFTPAVLTLIAELIARERKAGKLQKRRSQLNEAKNRLKHEISGLQSQVDGRRA